ncbi:MAG: hypothetical protein WC838_07825 [Candidatus Margulisiibacteriota bacterium]|jgi:hypothetical protein
MILMVYLLVFIFLGLAFMVLSTANKEAGWMKTTGKVIAWVIVVLALLMACKASYLCIKGCMKYGPNCPMISCPMEKMAMGGKCGGGMHGKMMEGKMMEKGGMMEKMASGNMPCK